NGQQTEDQLSVQQQQNHNVHFLAGRPDARIKQTTMNKNGQTNKTDHTKQTTGHHRNNLLQWRTDAQHMPDFNRGKQAKKVTEENTQHANVEQNTAGTQL